MCVVAVRRCVGSVCGLRALVGGQLFIIVPFFASLRIPWAPAHPNIAANTDTATLLSYSATQGSAFGQTRELLRAEYLQDCGLHLETVCDVSVTWQRGTTRIFRLVVVFCALELFVEAKAQAELTFMSDRQVREDEVASSLRTVQVDHAGHRCACKNCGLVWVWHATGLC